MKIGMDEINEGIFYSAENKLMESLEKEGFKVLKGSSKEMYDIYAEKGEDRRIYEIKIGKNKIQERSLKALQEIAKEKKAKLFVTYLEQPRSSHIEYIGIEDLLFEYIQNNMIDELDRLSTHTWPQEVFDVEINSITVNEGIIKIEGNASLDVELAFGSESDRRDGMGNDEWVESLDFFFKATIESGEIVNAYFKFDTEHYYE